METKNEIIFGNVTYQELEEIVNITKKDNDPKFDDWFSFKYNISESEQKLLESLIKKNKLFLSSYNEAKLFARFISPILYKVDFNFDDIQDWYESWLIGKVNGVRFSGKTDFMVAKGNVVPKKPYFFISEFKRSIHRNNPEYQLLAEMLVAIEQNKVKFLQGCFIIGEYWVFLILEKLENNSYEYFVSESFDCLKIERLQQIFINLQAAKALFCKD